MVTGDNILTTVTMARDCGTVSHEEDFIRCKAEVVRGKPCMSRVMLEDRPVEQKTSHKQLSMAKGSDDQLDKTAEEINLTSEKNIKNMKEAGVKAKEGEAGLNIPGKDKSTEASLDIISDSLRDPIPPSLSSGAPCSSG